jgi:hypothetical protein
MKKIIIIFSLILSLFINILPVYAVDYSTSPDMAGYSSSIIIEVTKKQSEDFEFILNIIENPTLEVYFYNKGETVIFTFYKIYSTASVGQYYFKTSVVGKNFDLDVTGKEIFSYDIYLLDDDGNRIYHTYIYSATNNTISFSSFAPYVEEDNKDDENTESSESTENTEESENPDDSGSSDNEGSQISQGDILHNDLMIIIIIIGFFEFMKMVNIIVRNFSGGDK